jgi:lambda family phage portal protein
MTAMHTRVSQPSRAASNVRARRANISVRRNIGSLLSHANAAARVPNVPVRIDATIAMQWTREVAHCQHVCEQSDHARKFIGMVRENVIGAHGITLLPQITTGTEGAPTPDIPMCDAIADAWAAFSEKGAFDATGALSRTDVEKQCVSSLVHTGEFLLQLVYGDDAGPWGFALRVLDPTRLNPNFTQQLAGGRFIKHGIEFTEFGRPVAYHLETDARDFFPTGTENARTVRIPADQILHGFISEYPGQKRGLPLMRTAVEQLRVLHDFTDAVLANARVSASKVGFYKDGKDADPAATVMPEDLPTEAADPGTFDYIGNYDFVSPDWQFPDASVEPFTRSLLRSAASGLNVSYNTLGSDLTSVNFSSIRQGAIEEREVWKGLQEWFISNFSVPVYRTWIAHSLLAGRIRCKGQRVAAAALARCMAVKFTGRRWAWIDPSSEIAAAEKAVSLKIKSRSQVMRDNGDVPYDVWTEIHTETQDMESLGLDPTVTLPGGPQPANGASTAQGAPAATDAIDADEEGGGEQP